MCPFNKILFIATVVFKVVDLRVLNFSSLVIIVWFLMEEPFYSIKHFPPKVVCLKLLTVRYSW